MIRWMSHQGAVAYPAVAVAVMDVVVVFSYFFSFPLFIPSAYSVQGQLWTGPFEIIFNFLYPVHIAFRGSCGQGLSR